MQRLSVSCTLTSKALCLPFSICPVASLLASTHGGGSGGGHGHPTLLVPPLHGEHALLTQASTPRCLAYLPALSQPSVVMLYGPDQVAEGQRSPGVEGGKRKRLQEEEEVVLVKKRPIAGLEERDKVRK